jgi:hypothetical protein
LTPSENPVEQQLKSKAKAEVLESYFPCRHMPKQAPNFTTCCVIEDANFYRAETCSVD